MQMNIPIDFIQILWNFSLENVTADCSMRATDSKTHNRDIQILFFQTLFEMIEVVTEFFVVTA